MNSKEIGNLYGFSREKARRLLHKFRVPTRGGRRTQNKTPNYTEEEKKLIALGIDFEGCISIGWFSKKSLQCFVVLASTDEKLMQKWLDLVRVGNIHCIIHNSQLNPRWKDAYSWRMTARQSVLHFLKQIEPYLVAKKQQAKLVIKALEGNISKALAKQRIHELNRKGPPT